MTTLILALFTAAMLGVILFGKKHEVLIASIINAVLLVGLVTAFSLNAGPNSMFYLALVFYFVIPMYGVIALFGAMKKNRAKKENSLA
ncbi:MULTISPECIES: hypothetical protein [Paenibacillus]|uniref:Uncharacterized protein n=1 Tax=Paenibacillus albilobatus TaxID=2716884 RepID=A0A919XEV8_9BACL|nr:MULTISPECIES: hypothetical protein [Paenibacillus]GIO29178.1 hypothetical protein J2TS6_03190 [Paenibacillus albilobatus]